MKISYFIATVILLLAVSPASNAQNKKAAGAVVTQSSFGRIKIGMTIAEAGKALGVRLIGYGEYDGGECYYVRPRRGFQNVDFMTDGWRITRIDVNGTGYSTDKGAKVGDSEARIKRLYRGEYKISSHKYVENGHYIEIESKDGKYNLLFETDGKRVTGFRSGRTAEVALVERCG